MNDKKTIRREDFAKKSPRRSHGIDWRMSKERLTDLANQLIALAESLSPNGAPLTPEQLVLLKMAWTPQIQALASEIVYFVQSDEKDMAIEGLNEIKEIINHVM